MIAKINATEDFPLKGFNEALKKMPAPDEQFNPAGEWENTYELYSLAGRGNANGSVRLQRRKKGNGIMLQLEYRKQTGGHPCLLADAALEFDNDLPGTPRNWKLYSRTEQAPGRVMPETELRKQAKCSAQGMRIETARTRKDEKVQGPFTISWALFEAVQRMPRKEGFSTDFFTLFDHFDQRKENHQIKYWKAADVAFPNGLTMKLHAFEQIGHGVLPIYYWVSDHGQLMAVISGIEGYMLKG